MHQCIAVEHPVTPVLLSDILQMHRSWPDRWAALEENGYCGSTFHIEEDIDDDGYRYDPGFDFDLAFRYNYNNDEYEYGGYES